MKIIYFYLALQFGILYCDKVFAQPECPKAADFKLRDQAGTLTSLNDIIKNSEKELIVLSVFQTTCVPCVEEIKYIQNIKRSRLSEGKKDFQFVLIDSNEDRQTTHDFLAKNHIDETVVLSDPNGKLDKLYDLTVIPKIIVIDSDKNIILQKEGTELSKLRASNQLADILIDSYSKRTCKINLTSPHTK